jgi:hypothetical protein
MEEANVGVFEALHDFKLLKDTVKCILTIASWLILETIFVHFFDSILDLSKFIACKMDSSKGPFAELFFDYVLVDQLLTIIRL